MTVDHVRQAVAEVARWRDAGDLEGATYRQGLLYRDVVNAIADGTAQGDPAELCREATKSAWALKG